MAKTQKYSEDLLLEAVVKYADEFNCKIKYSELVEWSRNNIPGLEGVRDFNFSRPSRVKNPKTGKIVEKKKKCTQRIEEINKARDIYSVVGMNMLLSTSRIDEVLNQPRNVQIKMIVEAREAVNELRSKNRYLKSTNEAYKALNIEQEDKISELEVKLKEVIKKQEVIKKRVDYIIKTINDEKQKEMLSKMGIEDGVIDLSKYEESIEEDISEIFDIGKELIKYGKEEKKQIKGLGQLLTEGLNFDDEE